MCVCRGGGWPSLPPSNRFRNYQCKDDSTVHCSPDSSMVTSLLSQVYGVFAVFNLLIVVNLFYEGEVGYLEAKNLNWSQRYKLPFLPQNLSSLREGLCLT